MNVVCGEQTRWIETAKHGGKVVVCMSNVYVDLTAYEGHEPEAQALKDEDCGWNSQLYLEP